MIGMLRRNPLRTDNVHERDDSREMQVGACGRARVQMERRERSSQCRREKVSKEV